MGDMRLGLDLDGVLVDSIPRWIAVLNREAGSNYTPADLPDTHGTPTMARHSDRHELEMLLAPRPMAGAVDATTTLLAGGHELVVISARSPKVRRLTEAWLEYHGLTVDRLHFLEGASKAPTARAEAIDLMVEDAPHNALALAASGIRVLLFAAPYNAGVRHPLIRRCDGWSDVLSAIAGVPEASRLRMDGA